MRHFIKYKLAALAGMYTVLAGFTPLLISQKPWDIIVIFVFTILAVLCAFGSNVEAEYYSWRKENRARYWALHQSLPNFFQWLFLNEVRKRPYQKS